MKYLLFSQVKGQLFGYLVETACAVKTVTVSVAISAQRLGCCGGLSHSDKRSILVYVVVTMTSRDKCKYFVTYCFH